MDNLTHSLVGLAAAKAGLERASPYATVVCVVAANLPDIDIVTLVKGPTVYLANHRGISHSLVGTLALGVALPVLFFLCERLLARLRGLEPRARFKGLMFCSLAAIATHPLLDWTNSYGLRPFLPWDARWVYGDILFIIDPWLWLLLGGACFLLTARSRRRVAVWALAALLLTLLFFLLGRRFGSGVPLASYVIWPAGLAAFLLLHRRGVAARFGPKVASAALALVVAYCGALALVHTYARDKAEGFAHGLASKYEETGVRRVAATPVFADPRTWRCFAETDRSTFRYDYTFGSLSLEDLSNTLRVEKPEGEARRLVERASADERARVLLDFARFPVARVVENRNGEAVVQFADLRFTEPGSRARVGGFAFDVVVKDPDALPNSEP